jgi:hypothetical protein
MMTRVFVILIALFAATAAYAQTSISATGQTITFTNCPAGSFWSGISNNTTVCTAAPTGGTGGSVTLTGTSCISVTGTSPNYTIGTLSTAVTKATSFSVTTADSCKYFIYKGTAAGTATIPPTTGINNGFGFEIEVPASSFPLTLAFGSAFHGGPGLLNPGQSAYIQVDDQGQWAMFSGVGQAVANPNAFH